MKTKPTISQYLCHFSPQLSPFLLISLPALSFLLFPSTHTFTPILSHLFVVSFSRNVCLIPSPFHRLKIWKRCHSPTPTVLIYNLCYTVHIAMHHIPWELVQKLCQKCYFTNLLYYFNFSLNISYTVLDYCPFD